MLDPNKGVQLIFFPHRQYKEVARATSVIGTPYSAGVRVTLIKLPSARMA
jgi:hypothetical protein